MNTIRTPGVCRLYIAFQNTRTICVTSSLCGRRATDKLRWLKMPEHPYDSRFPISPKDIGKSKHSGKIRKLLIDIGNSGPMMPQKAGFMDKKGKFHFVPEMIPEFVVPDLTDCKLKPYVSYRVPEITQTEMTAKDLFDATYGKDIVEKYKKGKIDPSTISPEDILKSKPQS